MEYDWVDVNERVPKVNRTGNSEQVVVKLQSGYLGTGYYNSIHDTWYLDGITSTGDTVVKWTELK